MQERRRWACSLAWENLDQKQINSALTNCTKGGSADGTQEYIILRGKCNVQSSRCKETLVSASKPDPHPSWVFLGRWCFDTLIKAVRTSTQGP